MQVFGPQSLNKRINLRAIEECIRVLELTGADTILLHPYNFDEVALEYRDTYGRAMPEPFTVNGVLVDEASAHDLTRHYVLVYLNDDRPERYAKLNPPSLADDDRPIYRCGYCGGIVDKNGREVSADTRALHIEILEARGHKNTKHAHGYCCQKHW